MALNILCLDDDEGVLDSIQAILSSDSYHVQVATNWKQAKLILKTDCIDVVLLDVNLGENERSGIDLLPKINLISPDTDVVIVTGERDPQLSIKAVRQGACDYYQKPIQTDLMLLVERVENKRISIQKCNTFMKQQFRENPSSKIIGRSEALIKVLEDASRLKGQTASVLIQAETGTGKELLAKYIYDLENRSDRPFVVINCSAIPDNLIESELFGHEKGAFTGADSRKIGLFTLAHGGDIFLDEVNSLRPDLQAKLLRVLQEKVVFPIGARRPEKADFRIISATNEDLSKLVKLGQFREDFYHRLNVVKLTMPPLRQRKEDIPLLVNHFLKKFDRKSPSRSISPEAMKYLISYDWPGNIRELENLIHSLIIMSRRQAIDVDDLPEHILSRKVHPLIASALKQIDKSTFGKKDLFDLNIKDFTKVMKKHYIQRALKQSNGNISIAANKTGMSRQTFYDMLKEQFNEQ